MGGTDPKLDPKGKLAATALTAEGLPSQRRPGLPGGAVGRPAPVRPAGRRLLLLQRVHRAEHPDDHPGQHQAQGDLHGLGAEQRPERVRRRRLRPVPVQRRRHGATSASTACSCSRSRSPATRRRCRPRWTPLWASHSRPHGSETARCWAGPRTCRPPAMPNPQVRVRPPRLRDAADRATGRCATVRSRPVSPRPGRPIRCGAAVWGASGRRAGPVRLRQPVVGAGCAGEPAFLRLLVGCGWCGSWRSVGGGGRAWTRWTSLPGSGPVSGRRHRVRRPGVGVGQVARRRCRGWRHCWCCTWWCR